MKKVLSWIAASAGMMLALPWMAVTFVKGDGGMAICFVLFFALNPIYAICVGASAVIRDGRIFMHGFTYAVSHQFAYNAITVRLTIALYGETYISNMISCYSILYT